MPKYPPMIRTSKHLHRVPRPGQELPADLRTLPGHSPVPLPHHLVWLAVREGVLVPPHKPCRSVHPCTVDTASPDPGVVVVCGV